MAAETFVDTSGFYALLVAGDDRHAMAEQCLRKAASRRAGFVTTDYVLDETATLLKARGHASLLPRFFSIIEGSSACRLEWTDSDRFWRAREFLLRHADQPWSFTDCVSFCLMREQGLRDALTKDRHFQQAGFCALLN
jgi:hypothetical protein